MAEKRCVTCKMTKPIDAFNRHRSSPDGKQARCRDCCKAWYVANRATHIRNAVSLRRILEEIAKCSVRCANCHRIRTAVQFGRWSTQIPPQDLRPDGKPGRRQRWTAVSGVFSVTSDGLQQVWRGAA